MGTVGSTAAVQLPTQCSEPMILFCNSYGALLSFLEWQMYKGIVSSINSGHKCTFIQVSEWRYAA